MTRTADLSTEAGFQSHVLRIARDLGWGIPQAAWQRVQEEAAQYGVEPPPMDGLAYHTRYSLGSDAGWPDLVLVRRADRRLLFAELKTDRGRVSARQSAVIELLRHVGAEVHLWRPADLPEIGEILR